MVQVVYKRRRLRTELPQPSTPRAAVAPASEASNDHKGPKPRTLHLKQYGITGDKSELLQRMQSELDALHKKR